MHTTNRFLKLIGLRPTGDLGGLTCYTSKRNKTVWFVKAPPTTPLTHNQRRQCLRFTTAAEAWQAIPQRRRDAWNLAACRGGLYCHGYNLWIYWQLTRDAATIRTVEQQTGLDLLEEQ